MTGVQTCALPICDIFIVLIVVCFEVLVNGYVNRDSFSVFIVNGWRNFIVNGWIDLSGSQWVVLLFE